MRRLLLILPFILLSCAKDGIGISYTVREGENIFYPYLPEICHTSPVLRYRFRIGPEWWAGDLTNPVGWGCKMPTIGRFSYHTGGANSAIGYSNGRVYWHPRYYEKIDGGYYKLHELTDYRIELQPDRWYEVRQNNAPLSWHFDGQLVVSLTINLPSCWFAPPFLGRSGNDNGYQSEPIPGAFAARELKMEVVYLR